MSVSNGQNVDAQVTNGAYVSRTQDTDTVGTLSVLNITNSSDEDTGALKTTGGAGIKLDLNVGGNTGLKGDVAIDGTATLQGDFIQKQFSQSILNGQAVPEDVVGVAFDKLSTHSSEILYDLFRMTDSEKEKEMGRIYVIYDEDLDDWFIESISLFDNSGVVFEIDSLGQVSYTSSSMAGANYISTLRITGITKVSL